MGIRIKRLLLISGLLAALLGLARAPDNKPAPPSAPPANAMPDMDMASMNHDNADPDSGAAHAMDSMQTHHMDPVAVIERDLVVSVFRRRGAGSD